MGLDTQVVQVSVTTPGSSLPEQDRYSHQDSYPSKNSVKLTLHPAKAPEGLTGPIKQVTPVLGGSELCQESMEEGHFEQWWSDIFGRSHLNSYKENF